MHCYCPVGGRAILAFSGAARRHFGVLDRPVQYQILIIPPESH